MRSEAFNNNNNNHQPKAKVTKNNDKNHIQLSQRSTQSYHQKTNSMSTKIGNQNLNNIMTFDEQSQHQHNQYHILGSINGQQPSAPLSQYPQQPSKLIKFQNVNVDQQQKYVNQNTIHNQGLVSNIQPPSTGGAGGAGAANGGNSGSANHKKSNSLMNSKMAQILLKGGNPNVGSHIQQTTPQQLVNVKNNGKLSQNSHILATTNNNQNFIQQQQQQQLHLSQQQPQTLQQSHNIMTQQNASLSAQQQHQHLIIQHHQGNNKIGSINNNYKNQNNQSLTQNLAGSSSIIIQGGGGVAKEANINATGLNNGSFNNNYLNGGGSQQNNNNNGNDKSQQNSFSQENNNNNNHHVNTYSFEYQKPLMFEDYQDQTNISSQLYSQQTPLMTQNPSIKQINNNHKPQFNANLINHHQQPTQNIEVLMSQNIMSGNNQIDSQAPHQQIIQFKKPQQLQQNPTKTSASMQQTTQLATTNNHHTQYPQKGNSAQKSSKKAAVTSNSQGNTINGVVSGGPNHSRTKSDNYYNRGSITIKQSVAASNGYSNNKEQSQSKRIISSGGGIGQVQVNAKNKNVQSIIEAQEVANSRQIVQPGKLKNTAATAGGHSLLQSSNDTKIVPLSSIRKVPNSANHSKKVSQSSNQSQAQGKPTPNEGSSQQKKTTKEKYLELKAMYDDLLERHYVQQQQFQHQQKQLSQNNNNNSNTNNKFTQQINNFILSSGQQLFNQPQPIQHIAHQSSTFDHSYQPSTNTPRLINSNNQLSHSNFNMKNIQLGNISYPISLQVQQQQDRPILIQQKQIKTSSNSGINSSLNNDQDKVQQPKSILKFQVPAQGQSRKNAQGNHKRSVSDGNEQLFKFKQNFNNNATNQPQQMQRQLFPQSSNSNIQGTNLAKPSLILTSDREEIMAINNRGKPMTNQQSQNQILLATSPYQQQNHQRRVSDDFKQKQIKTQQNKQYNNTLIGNQQQYQRIDNQIKNITDAKKTNTIDFNIKEFLLEMRNKHNQLVNCQAPDTSEFINIIDEQLYSYNPPSPNTSNNPNLFDNQINYQNGSQFAMIIEENSPTDDNNFKKLHLNNPIVVSVTSKSQNNNNLQEISRKASFLVDSQSQLPLKQTTKNKGQNNNNDFTQIIQTYKQKQLFDQKRTSSPNLELDTTPFGFQKKNQLFKTKHKRVKSDVNEGNLKNINHIQNISINNPVNIQSSIIQTNGTSSFSQTNQKKKLTNYPISQITNNSNKSQIGGSSVNLFMNSDKNTPKKQISNQQKYQKQNTGLFNQQQLSSQLESSNSKKVINVSIDLIKDGMSAGIIGDSAEGSFDEEDSQDIINSEYRAGAHWIVVENGVTDFQKEMKKPQQVITKDSQSSFLLAKKITAFSGPGPENDSALRQNKYKKMINKYDKIIDNNNMGYISSKKYTSEVSPNDKINLSSSCSPSVIGSNQSPANRLSLNDRMNEVYKKQLSNKILMPLSPKSSLLQQKQKIKINNLMQQQPFKKSFQEKQLLFGNAKQPKLYNAPPNNSAVNTQETPKASPQNIQQIHLTIQAQMNVGERVETQESAASDPNLSPRTKGVNKLMKHIKLSFKQTTLPPNTTVDFYRIGKVLGKGAFGKVNLALHKLSGKFAAVKSINKQYLSEEAQTKKVMQEVVILKRTRHRNIVRLYEFFETQKHILFVMELCAGGDLLNYVRRRRRLKEDVAKSIFKQIIEGLDYCHSKSILHRDIKLDNILLDSEGEVKICDFGVSKIVKPGEIMNEQCGTPAYIAPEILRDKGYQGFAADIWSVGVVLYAMLYGTVPFKANNMSELQKLIIKAKYTLKEDGISEDARSLLTGLLEKDPHKRLTIEQILNHKWLRDVNEKIQLFTELEKEYIKNEFTYNDAERYNRNETDPFTEHMLDSTNNSMLKNQSSKSVILAPFNSTKSNFEPDEPALSESMKALLQSKRCIKFAARVRDIDKQYEINNNADLDNGVYHKIEDEEVKNEDQNAAIHNNKDKSQQPQINGDDSLQSSFNKESSMKSDDDEETLRIKQQKQIKKNGKEKQTELEKLESLIYQQEDDLDNPYQGNNKDFIFKDHIDYSQVNIQVNESPRSQLHSQRDRNSQQLLFKIDEKVINLVEQMGYPRDYITKCLQNNELNYATSAYYLFQNKHSLSFI